MKKIPRATVFPHVKRFCACIRFQTCAVEDLEKVIVQLLLSQALILFAVGESAFKGCAGKGIRETGVQSFSFQS